MSGIFLSYRREDSIGHAGWLGSMLIAEFGKDRVFMDLDSIEPGLDFGRMIERAVSSCDALVALIGKEWVTAVDNLGRRRLDNDNDFVRAEIAVALRRDVRVVPVLVHGAAMPQREELPHDIRQLAWRNAIVLSDEHFAADVGLLINALRRFIPPPESVPSLEPEVTPNPRGPAAGMQDVSAPAHERTSSLLGADSGASMGETPKELDAGGKYPTPPPGNQDRDAPGPRRRRRGVTAFVVAAAGAVLVAIALIAVLASRHADTTALPASTPTPRAATVNAVQATAIPIPTNTPESIQVSLLDVSAEGSSPQPGDEVTLDYRIDNESGTQVQLALGATLIPAGSTQQIIDTAHDTVVTAGLGTNTYQRLFTATPGLVAGQTYNLWATINSSDFARSYGSLHVNPVFTVGTP